MMFQSLISADRGEAGADMVKAYWNGYEIYDLDYHEGWVEILFWMNDFESPITGTGRWRVRPEDIVLEER